MDPLVLLASDLLDVDVLVRSPVPHVVVAVAPGGPHTNQKEQRMEDSLAVVHLPDGGVAAVVADAHHGAGAGERLTRHLVALLEASPPKDAAALRELVLTADEKACRFARDQSQSTLLVATLHGATVHWVSVADSLLLRLERNAVTRINPGLGTFAGGTFPLRALLAHPRGGATLHLAAGTLELGATDTLVVASDGIEEEMTALALPRLANLFGAAPSLEAGAWALLNRWRDVQAGGGRDNVAAVLMQAAR